MHREPGSDGAHRVAAHLARGGTARRRPAEELHRTELADRGFAGRARAHGTLASDPRIGAQWNVDALGTEFPLAPDEGEVALLETVRAQERVQAAQRARVARDQQAPAGIAVEAMHEFEGIVRVQGAQCLDDPETHPAAAVDRDTGRLVEHQELLVLVDDGLAEALAQPR